MQDLVGGDNNRTPVIFQVPDIYRFVGDMPYTFFTLRMAKGISLPLTNTSHIVFETLFLAVGFSIAEIDNHRIVRVTREGSR